MSDFDARISREIDKAEDILRQALLRTVTTGRAPNTVERTVGVIEDIKALADAVNDLRKAFETKMDALITALSTSERIADGPSPAPKTRRAKKVAKKKTAKKKTK